MRKLALVSVMLMLSCSLFAQWGKAPAGWNDFYIGLTDDATKLTIITTAKATTGLHYRVRYINEGVNIATNWYSHLPSGGLATNFINQSTAIGMNPAFNIYMLQEDGGADVAIANMANLSFMQQYFWNIRDVAQKCNGKKAILVIEPDTWGYLVKKCYGNGPLATSGSGVPTIRPNLVFCNVNNLGYPELAGLPNTMAGMAQGIIKMIRAYAPDAYIGFHTNHWAVWSNGADGTWATPSGAWGMPFWNNNNVNTNVDYQIAWYNELLGGSSNCDKGDFLAVEKYGFDEGGRWTGDASKYYTAAAYTQWLRWCQRFGQGLNLPLLGWQIPIGHTGLPNNIQEYEDTFMQNFFANKQNYICAGFIGLFMGPGVGLSTYYTNGAGTPGDDGWFFANLRTQLDPGRPINMNLSTVSGCSATQAACGALPVTWLSFTGERESGQDVLKWVTGSEINSAYFAVEQSIDAIHFTTIGYVQAKGNSILKSEYQYATNAPAGVAYYRLKQVDIDGQSAYSVLVAVGSAAITQFAIFPNPAQAEVNIVSGSDNAFSAELIDAQGRSVLWVQGQGTINLSSSTLPRGVYMVRLTDLKVGEVSMHKLVLN